MTTQDNHFHDFYQIQTVEDYDKAHAARLDHFVADFQLNQLSEQRIADFGCGYGCLFKRLKGNNLYYGFDGWDGPEAADFCEYSVVNLDLPFADEFLANNERVDIAFCLEVAEHLTNPYNLLYEIKKVLKEDGKLYLTIPDSRITHNTIYPSLIYPPENFEVFLGQMAFEIVEKKIHTAAFAQVVYVLKNKSWDHCKMVWEKPDEEFKGKPPHLTVNM